MWVRVLFCGASMRGPACVPDAVSAVEGFQADHLFQVAQLAFRATDLKMAPPAVLTRHGDARRVIAAIFKLLQPVNDHWDNAFFSDITYDSAHSKKPCLSPAAGAGNIELE